MNASYPDYRRDGLARPETTCMETLNSVFHGPPADGTTGWLIAGAIR
jgi:hypothetical protein